MPDATVDARQIIEILRRHRVRFVVLGGFAVELWDVAIPPTVDVDITPEPSKANLTRLAAALNELDAALRHRDEVVWIPGGFTAENIVGLHTLNLTTKAGPLDITLLPDGTGGYRDLSARSSDLDYRGTSVPTASLEDVARSKEAAGRPKDIVTLPAIRAHIERAGREKPD